MSIKIPVSAEFDGDDVKKQIAAINAQFQRMGETVAKANQTKFNPITLQTKEDLKYFVQQSEKLMKIQAGMRSQMVKSGQGGKNPLFANWGSMYLNEATRLKRMQEMLVFFGNDFDEQPGKNQPRAPKPAPLPPVNRRPGGGGRGISPTNPWTQQGTNILQSGLRGFGPVGGVAAEAVGTSAGSGFGAGMMGLMGGLIALGIGKAVSSVVENLDKAERNNVGYDTLKRTIGDVNVSFEGLKTIIEQNANNLGITYEESAKLATQFSKLGNVSSDRYQQLGDEVTNATGFSRGFGLDPSLGTSFFGQMRGMRMTSNDQDSRRMGLLIGEAIGKSGAFSKADEVMEAIASFATSQTRNSLSRANISAYAGQYSALVGSGIPGLDPAGAGGMLSRINSSLMSGGAKGEASQFFSSMVANRMGLDPIQAAILREGGAFATNDMMFGAGSAAARYGVKGPGGSKTFLEETLATLRGKYSDPGMLAMATSGHLGIGMNQAMALLGVKPNQMGDLQRGLDGTGIDISRLNSSGIANLAKAYGSDSDRKGLAESLLRRDGADALTPAEADRLRNTMAGGDVEAQKKMLTELIATREQERTTGSDIRDSKNILDNIKTSLADKLIPLTQEMRHGIMSIAGHGGKETPQEIMKAVIESEYRGKADSIKQRYQSLIDAQSKRIVDARASEIDPEADDAIKDPNERMRAQVARQERSRNEQEAANAEIKRLEAERDAELSANGQRSDSAVKEMYRNSDASMQLLEGRDGSLDALVSAMFQQESGGVHRDANGNLITSPKGAQGISQVMPKTGTDPGYGVQPLQDQSEAEYRRFGRDYLAAMLRNYGGDRRKALAAYNAGPGSVDSAVKKYGDDWMSHLPQETQNYVPSILRKLPQRPAQLPANDAGNTRHDVNVTVGSLEVIHKNDRGEQVAPTQTLQPVVTAARPFGMGG